MAKRVISWSNNDKYSNGLSIQTLEGIIRAEFSRGNMEVYDNKIVLKDATLEYSQLFKDGQTKTEFWYESGQFFKKIVFTLVTHLLFKVEVERYDDNHVYGLCDEDVADGEPRCDCYEKEPEIIKENFSLMIGIFMHHV